MAIIEQVKKLKNSELKKRIDLKLEKFKSFSKKNDKQWFSELCFCLLTANSKARTALQIQKELGSEGFSTLSFEELKSAIKRNKHRFHNNKAKFIVNARNYMNIKKIIGEVILKKGEISARDWLVENIKGIGYKEASHFLRNVGYFDFAILDRHILRALKKEKIIPEVSKTLTRKRYLEYESQMRKLAQILKMSLAELDMYIFYIYSGSKTNEILK